MNYLRKKWAVLSVFCMALIVSASSAFAQATTIEVLKKEADGSVGFYPGNLADSIQTVVIDSYQYWAVIFLIVIAIGFMIMIFRKKS